MVKFKPPNWGYFSGLLGDLGGLTQLRCTLAEYVQTFFDPNVIEEIRETMKDILTGVEPEKKISKRLFESSHRAIPGMRVFGTQNTPDK